MKNTIVVILLFLLVGCGKDGDSNPIDTQISEIDFGERISKVSFVGSIDEEREVQLQEGLRMITLKVKTRSSQPMALYILEADLKNPNLAVRVATPDDAEAFKLQPVTDIAAAADKPGNKVLAAVNADYFYWTGEPWGPVVKRGKILREEFRDPWHGFFGVGKDKHPIVGSGGTFENHSADLEEAVGGEYRLINNGRRVSHENSDRHPRTVVGYDENSLVYIMVVDGRKPLHSIGMNLGELSEVLFSLKVKEAITLDGGGSTTLVVKDNNAGSFGIVNEHSDPEPRAVANALAIVSLSN